MMKTRYTSRLSVLLALSLLLSACAAAVPGGAPIGTPSGNTVAAPSEYFGATGERTENAGGGSGEQDVAAEPGEPGIAGGSPAPMPISQPAENSGPSGIMKKEVLGYTPTIYPAPIPDPEPLEDPFASDDCTTYAAALDGRGTLCRKQDGGLMMTAQGFVRRCINDKVSSENYSNGYTLSILNSVTKKTVEAHLENAVVTTKEGDVEKSGHFYAVVDFAKTPYPSCKGDLKFSIKASDGRISTFQQTYVLQTHLKAGKVLPTSVIASLPYDLSDLPSCGVPISISNEYMILGQ